MKKPILSILFVICLSFQASAWNPMVVVSGGGGECRYNDHFTGANDSQPSAVLWDETDVDDDMNIQSNSLNYSKTGTAADGAQINSTWTFTANSDWEVIVDYAITTLDAPNAGSTNSIKIMAFNSGATIYSIIGRMKDGSDADDWVVAGTASGYVDENDDVGVASGRLRLVMSSGTLTGYYWDDGAVQWEWNGSTNGYTFSEDFTDEAIYIQLRFDKAVSTASTTMDVNLDNFTVVSGCP